MKNIEKIKPALMQVLRLAFSAFFVLGFFPVSQVEAALLKEARVTRVVNDVDLIDAAQARRDARTNDVMRDDMVLATGHKSRAELQFTDQTLARIGANSFFTFSEGTRNMELGKGTMLLKVPKGAGGAKISTQSVTAAITGTTVLLETNPGGEIVMKSDTPLPPTPEADEDLRRQGLGAYVGQGLSSVPSVSSIRPVSVSRPASGQIRVAEVSGSVRVMEPGQTTSRPLNAGENLPEGTFIMTQQGGSAIVSSSEGVASRITESSSVRVEEVEVQPGVPPKVLYDLKEGSILFSIGREDGEKVDYKIRTSQGVVAARGTVGGTTSRNGQTGVFGGHGSIFFSFGGNQQNIAPGQFNTFTGTGGNIQLGTNIPANSGEFQMMMQMTVQLVDRAAGLGLVRPGLPNDVRAALQQAGIPTPPPAQRPTANPGQPNQEGSGQQSSPQPTAGNQRRGGRGSLQVQSGSQAGFSKMIVVEGTMRVYLNDRLGESMLIRPGEMIILNPNANRLPRPVKVDLNRLVRSSRLVTGMDENNDPADPGGAGLANDPVLTDGNVREALDQQKEQIQKGELATTDVAVVKNRLLPKSTILGDTGDNKTIIDRRTNVANRNTLDGNRFFQKPPTIPGTTTIRENSQIVGAPPTITTANGTATGSIYPAASPQSIAEFAFEDGERPIDNAISSGEGGPNQPLDKNAALFKFETLRVTGNPQITQTTDQSTFGSFLPELVGLISLNDLLVGNGLTVGPNAGLGLPEEIFLVSEKGSVTVDNTTLNGLKNDWVFYGRGGDVTINNSNFGMPSGDLSFAAQSDITTTGTNNFNAGHLDFISLVNVDLTNANSLTTNSLNVSGQTITLPAVIDSNSGVLSLIYNDMNGSPSPVTLDSPQFALITLDSFQGLFSGTDVEINNNFDINGRSLAELELGTDEIFDINGVSVSANGADFASVDIIGEQGITLLTGTNVDAISSDGSAKTMLGSSSGPIQISDNASILADGDSDARLFVDAGTNSFDLGTFAGPGGSLTATSSFGEAEVGVNSRQGLTVNGASSIDASGEGKSMVNLNDRGITGLAVGSGATISSSSVADEAFTHIKSTLGDISIGNNTGISADGSLNSVVDLSARSGLQVGTNTTLQAGSNTPGDAASVNINNSTSGDITLGNTSQITAQTNATGTGNIAITNSGGGIDLGFGTGGSTLSANGGSEHHIDLDATTGINVNETSSITSDVTGNGQATVSLNNSDSGNISVDADTTIRATSDQNGTGNHTTVKFQNDGGQILVGQGSGAPTVIQAEVTNDAGTGLQNVPSIFFEATDGVEIRNTSDIHAVLGAAVNGQGKIFVKNNGSGDILIGDGATLTADSGVNASVDPLQEGEIFIENHTGNVEIGNGTGGATLTAERINARALGTAGMVKIFANSNLSASKQISLFANTTNGTVLMTGTGNIGLDSPNINIQSNTFEVSNGTTVNVANNSNLVIEAANRNFSSGGFGNVQFADDLTTPIQTAVIPNTDTGGTPQNVNLINGALGGTYNVGN